MNRSHLRASLLILTLALAGAGCDGERNDAGPPSASAAEVRTPVHVDSILPMEEEIRRFRADLPPATGLAGGTGSQEELVDAVVAALEAADTTALASLALTPSEFAWIYFPHTIYTSPPYELSPALVWFHQQNRSSRGLARLLRRYSGETLFATGHRCPDEGEAFGEGWIWHGCAVLGELPTGESVEERLFGSILEWEGRYKLVSFSNEF